MQQPPPAPQFAGPWVDVRSYARPGYPLDGTQPWDQFIQEAVDYLVDNTLASIPAGTVGTLYLPPGRYRIDNPIRIRKEYVESPTSKRYAYCSIRITGDAPPYGHGDFHSSALLAEFTDLPAIIIQAGLAVRLENLFIQGKNDWVSGLRVAKATVLHDDGTFLTGDVTDERKHAPYAGICIDPFAEVPKPPPAPEEFYPGLRREYLPSAGSSEISISQCQIRGFVVGIAISPNAFSAKSPLNAENISIDDCTIISTKSAIVLGHDQTRGLSCRNLRVYGAKYAIDCTHYGKGSGCPPSIYTANIGLTKYIFSTHPFGSGAAFDGIYCEGTLSLGTLRGGGSSDGYAFSGCGFNLVYAPDHPSVGYHLANLARATFTACQFTLIADGPEESGPLWMFNAGRMSFRDCQIGITNYPANSPPFWILGAPWKVSFGNTEVPYLPHGAVFSEVLQVDDFLNIRNQAVLPGCRLHQFADPSPGTSPRWVSSGLRRIPLDTVEKTGLALQRATGRATFQPTTPGVVAPGDLIYFAKSYFGVIDGMKDTPIEPVLGRVISIDPQTGLVTVGHVPEYVFSRPAPGPADSLSVVGFYKIHEPVTGRVVQDGNSDSTVVKKLAVGPGVNATAWIVGDRIRAKEGFIPAGTYVAAVQTDGDLHHPGLTELTLSQPLTGFPASGELTLYDAEVRTFTPIQVF